MEASEKPGGCFGNVIKDYTAHSFQLKYSLEFFYTYSQVVYI